MAQAGFDTNHIPVSKFKWLLKTLSLVDNGLVPVSSYDAFKFSNEFITIYTGNHPITGKYSKEGQRENDKGYCSYIGIEGDEAWVKIAYNIISSILVYEPEGNPTRREFI